MKEILKRAYTPFSGTDEFCLVQGESGTVYPGVRIENSSFPLTISAIQAAVSSCLANSDRPVSYWHGEKRPELSEYWSNEYHLKQNDDEFDLSQGEIFNPFINEIQNISDTLRNLCKTAITPNSNFSVSAILETERGFVAGVNVEGGAWSLGLCAERVAVSRAVAAGADDFLSLHIMAPKSDFCSPCGACRQVIHEFMPKRKVHLYHSNQQKTVHFAEHLLPYAFTATSL